MGKKLDFFSKKLREKSNRNFLPFYKFPQGRSDIRIVPAPIGQDEDDWFLPTGMHYNVNEKIPVYCPDAYKLQEEPCALCEMVAELRKEGLNDEANRMAVRRRVFIRAIVRGQEEKGVQLLNLPVSVFTAICEIVQDTDTWGKVLSPGPDGRDIRITKTGQNLNTEYHTQALPKTSPMMPTKDQVKEILASLVPMDDLIPAPDGDEVYRIAQEKMGYTAFGSSEPSTGDGWEAENDAASDDDEEEEEQEEEATTPGWPDGDESWLEVAGKDSEKEEDEEEDDEELPDLAEVVKQDSVKTNLTAELNKKHKVKKG